MRLFTFEVEEIIFRHASDNLVNLGHESYRDHAFGQRLCRPTFFESVHHVVTANDNGEVFAVALRLFDKRPMPRVEQVERAKDEDAGHGCSVAELLIVDLPHNTA